MWGDLLDNQQEFTGLGIVGLRDGVAAYLVSSGNRLAGAYAVAGYPAITVPAGLLDDSTAVGLTFTGRYLEDGPLIGYAYAFEQASGLRELPPMVVER